MKKIIVSLVCSVLASLFSQAALADDPPKDGKSFPDQVCDALKQCKDDSAKNPTIKYVPSYVCQGDFLPAKSNFAHPCVCAEGKLPYVLNYGWEILPRINPDQPNVRFFKSTIYCGENQETVRKDLGMVKEDVKSLFDDLKGYKEYVQNAFGSIASELKRVEGKADKAKEAADQAQQTGNEAKEDARKASELAQSRPTRAWVYAHSSRLFGGVSAVFLPMDSGMAGMGMLDVGWGKLYGDGTWGWQASLRTLYAPGSFSSGLSRNNGQVWGGGASAHVTISPWEDKRLQILVGGSYTQFWTPNENLGRAAFLGLVEGGVRIPLSDEVGLRFLIGVGDEAHRREDGTQREHGLAGMFSAGIVF